MKATSLMAMNQGAVYTLYFPHEDKAVLADKVNALATAEEILVQRRGKTRKKSKGRNQRRTPVMRTIDIRPMIAEIRMREGSEIPAVELTLISHEGRGGKAREIVPMLTERPELVKALRRETLTEKDGIYQPICADWDSLPPVPRACLVVIAAALVVERARFEGSFFAAAAHALVVQHVLS